MHKLKLDYILKREKVIDMKKFNYTGTYINKTNHHIYIAPAKELEDIIAHYTITTPNDIPSLSKEYHIIPDASGCFIFQEDRRNFWGAMSEIVILNNDLQFAPERFFVEFKPTGLFQISGLSQRQFNNKRDRLDYFDLRIDLELQQIYQDSEDYYQLINNFNHYFIDKRKENILSKRFIKAKELIDQNYGKISLEEVAKHCQVSSRQLLRDFYNYIGLSGKDYAKVVRFNCLLKNINNEDMISLAMKGGYFDQAHFNKVFKQITKTTPTKYLMNLSDFYNEVYKF